MKYILMITEDVDVSTNKIAHWLKYNYSKEIVRINENCNLNVTDIQITSEGESTFTLVINGDRYIKSDEIHSYWFRRGVLRNRQVGINQLFADEGLATIKEKQILFKAINEFYNLEWENISEFLHYLLKNSKILNINSHFDLASNRLINTEIAKNIGLKIPDTIISNNVVTIESFLQKHSKVITKCIYLPGLSKPVDNNIASFNMGTNFFSMEDLDKCGKPFQPTLFQEYIEKEFEIRTFYCLGETYSMAIFSQENEKTKVDFRNYDDSLPNRNIPFKLPVEINNKIKSFMELLKYDSGSIDIIYNHNDYYFLEINTVGQFDWVSKSCNYYLEKKIALKLKN
ncbi:MAG TPA: grasp-with-spasm system ATP-grasp peptide maturase [Bacteroidia bacterium]